MPYALIVNKQDRPRKPPMSEIERYFKSTFARDNADRCGFRVYRKRKL